MTDEKVSGGRKRWGSTGAHSGHHYGHLHCLLPLEGLRARALGCTGLAPLTQQGSRTRLSLSGSNSPSQSSRDVLTWHLTSLSPGSCLSVHVSPYMRPSNQVRLDPSSERAIFLCFLLPLPIYASISESIISTGVTSMSDSVPASKEHRAVDATCLGSCSSGSLEGPAPFPPVDIPLRPPPLGSFPDPPNLITALFCLGMWLFTPLASPLPDGELLQSSVCVFSIPVAPAPSPVSSTQ